MTGMTTADLKQKYADATRITNAVDQYVQRNGEGEALDLLARILIDVLVAHQHTGVSVDVHLIGRVNVRCFLTSKEGNTTWH